MLVWHDSQNDLTETPESQGGVSTFSPNDIKVRDDNDDDDDDNNDDDDEDDKNNTRIVYMRVGGSSFAKFSTRLIFVDGGRQILIATPSQGQLLWL